VEKNDLSPHSTTKSKRKVLATVVAADSIPSPFPEKSETASSAWLRKETLNCRNHIKYYEPQTL